MIARHERSAGARVRIRAAVLVEPGRPLEVDELELEQPRRDEVLVRLRASGICRSDLSLLDGSWPVPRPMVLGHEGAGVIEAVGPGVSEERVGENVVLTFAPACGRCRFCLEGRVNLCSTAAAGYETGMLPDGTTRLARKGVRVHHLAFVSSFASHAVVPASAAIAIDGRLDPTLACLLGCGVTTGVMAVTRRANVRPGESVAVFACGGVGLAAVQGARLVSADPVIAVEPVAAKRELALRLGATHALDPDEVDPVATIRELVPGGVDVAVEALGAPTVIEQAFASVRDGGTTVLIGQPAMGVKAAFPIYDVTQFEHTVLGTNLGGSTPALHVPQLARLALAGRLDLASMVTHRFPLDQINDAVATTASGSAGRVVVEL
jgi:Zn-dependent alcohol dehydrogenase